jgi:hypothetical protein
MKLHFIDDDNLSSGKNYNKLLKKYIALILIVFMLLFPAFNTINIFSFFEDLGYPTFIINKVSYLKSKDVLFFKNNIFSPGLSFLIDKIISDKNFDDNEKKLLLVLQSKLINKNLDLIDSCTFYKLRNLENIDKLLDLNIDLKKLINIKFDSIILDKTNIVIYKINSEKIPILMYHTLDLPYMKSNVNRRSFVYQLSTLSKLKYTTIKLSDYLNSDFSSVPEGRKPIVLTFDDALGNQFNILDNGTIDPNCMIGLLESNSKKYPDFGKNANFFIYLSVIPFDQGYLPELLPKKIKYLFDNGYEIGCHTYHHKYLGNSDKKDIEIELNLFYQDFEKRFGDKYKQCFTFAYPGGQIPKDINTIINYNYKDNKLKACFKASGGFSFLPYSKNFKKYGIERIDAANESINSISYTETFVKKSFKVEVPKIITLKNDLLVNWIKERKILGKGEYFFRLESGEIINFEI